MINVVLALSYQGIGGQEVFQDSASTFWLVFHGWQQGKAGYQHGGERAVHFHPLAEIEKIAGPLQS